MTARRAGLASVLQVAARLVAQGVGGGLFLVAASCFVVAYALPPAAYPEGVAESRFPWGQVPALVAAEGHVILGLQPYGRIEVYSPAGELADAWFVETDGGIFYLRWWEDSIQVYVVRRAEVVEFTMNGKSLGVNRTARVDERQWNQPGEPYSGNGATYSVRSAFVAPQVVRIVPGDGKEVVIEASRWWFFGAPHPAFVFGLLGAVLLAAGRVRW